MNRPHIHLDAVGGIAGDMFVAALLDAWPSIREQVLADVSAVLPASVGIGLLEKKASGALCGKGFRLALNTGHDAQGPMHQDGLETQHRAAHGHSHHHDHEHGHSHHQEHAPPRHGEEAPHQHIHAHTSQDDAPGGFRKMVERIRSAQLSPGAADHATAILTHIAHVEAAIHDVPLDHVHFHEIADWDSLMDVVAAGSIVAAVNGSWSVSDLPRGGGVITTQHGLLPVPAPATAALLTGFRWRDDGVSGERVTPTGAAILKHIVRNPGLPARAGGRLAASGMGVGTRSLPGVPNVLRAMVFDTAPDAGRQEDGHEGDTVAVITFDIDDMTGEEIAVAADHLRACDGVVDVAIGTMAGKKSRPVSSFRLLARPDKLAQVKEYCFTETSTIGLRWRLEQRHLLVRTSSSAMQGGMDVRVKQVRRPGNTASRKVESDDLASTKGLAARRNIKMIAEHKP